MKAAIIGGWLLVAGVAACSNDPAITPESSGGSGGDTMMLTGAGAASPDLGDMGGSAGAPPGSGKLVTADTDAAQYQSIAVDPSSSRPIVQGPFFVTDVLADGAVTLFTVVGSDCSAPQTKVLVAAKGVSQFHGIRLPILAGQSLCHHATATGALTVLGFKPY